MAYINGNEILFSAIINGVDGDGGGITLDDVDVSNVAVHTAVAGGVTGAGKGTTLRVTLTDGEETKSKNYGITTDPITADVIKKGTNILGVEGTFEGDGIDLDDVSVQSVAVNTAISGGLTGAGKGTVLSVTLAGDGNTKSANYGMTTDPITADVIKKGVNILGVTGTLETGSGGIELADVGVQSVKVADGLPQSLYIVLSANGESLPVITSVASNSDPIVAGVIKKGTRILGVTGTAEVGGVMLDQVSVVASSVHVSSTMPTYLNYQLTDGTSTTFAMFVKMNTDPITPDVIKKGVNILGVVGTYEGDGEITGRDIVDVSITEV